MLLQPSCSTQQISSPVGTRSTGLQTGPTLATAPKTAGKCLCAMRSRRLSRENGSKPARDHHLLFKPRKLLNFSSTKGPTTLFPGEAGYKTASLRMSHQHNTASLISVPLLQPKFWASLAAV